MLRLVQARLLHRVAEVVPVVERDLDLGAVWQQRHLGAVAELRGEGLKIIDSNVAASVMPSSVMLRSLSSDCLHMWSKASRSFASMSEATRCFHSTDGMLRPSCVSFCRSASEERPEK